MMQAIHNTKCGKVPGPEKNSPRIYQEPRTLRFQVASSFCFHLHAPQPPPKTMEKSQHHSNPETWQGR